jgi:hypothetical protein
MPKEFVNGVTNYYGPRVRGDTQAGQIGTVGAEKQLVIFFSGENFAQVRATLPAGAVVHGQTVVEIAEAFNLGGTTPVWNIGLVGAEGTNRVAQISEAQAEAVGTYSIAPAGTLAVNTPLAAAADIRVALGGTTPTTGLGGLCKLVVKYTVI